SDGKSAPFGETNAQLFSLTLSGDFDAIKISSNTGYNRIKYKSSYSQDNTSLGQSIVLERYFTREFSQEIRATTDFQSPVNFVAGAYYQDVLTEYRSSFVLNYGLYDPVSDLYNPYVRLSEQVGKTYSVFGQAIANITDKLELTAGGRFTRETKSYRTGNEFGRNAFATPTTVFPGSNEPGILKDDFKGNNFSPEVTLSWHPTPDSTLYGSYKTGYKSGGFLLGGFLNRTSTIGDFDFGPEKVKGFEIGAKGYLADRKLRLSATAYAYNFSNLQVNVFDPSLFAYVVANAGQLRQRGVDVEANFRANDNLSLHAGATYARNRFKNFVGQCYGYGFPAGSTRATATPPPGCSFVNSTSLILQQDFNGRAPARSPDFTANAGIVAEHALDAVKLGATGDLFYTDGYYASDTQSPFSWQPNFIRVNASLSISDRDDRWKVALTGKNLTNEYYLVLGAEQTGGASNPGQFGQQRGFVSRGREVILQTSFKF
ncbi:TonB-dependent receptor, partial [Sphingobium sp.]|uniref:TonB-dependent receptor n=1 Tax=Sphingobium sp. TaxID=1912891 RepID=UPI002BDDFE21